LWSGLLGPLVEGLGGALGDALAGAFDSWWNGGTNSVEHDPLDDFRFNPRDSDSVSPDGSEVRQDTGLVFRDTDGDGRYDQVEYDYPNDNDLDSDFIWDPENNIWKRAWINFESYNVAASVGE
jgi:hypothetical protein